MTRYRSRPQERYTTQYEDQEQPIRWQHMNGENFPGYDALGVRPCFVMLAGAFPAAKPDAVYWEVLTEELADIPEPVLHEAVRYYIRTNDNAYRLPTVAELLKFSRRAGETFQRESAEHQDTLREDAQEAEFERWMANLERVIDTIPIEDNQELQARITAAYEETESRGAAHALLFTHLLDVGDAPQPGWYCPTELAAERLLLDQEAYEAAYNKYGGFRFGETLDDELVQRMTERFPGKFRVRYLKSLAHLLDPDGVA